MTDVVASSSVVVTGVAVFFRSVPVVALTVSMFPKMWIPPASGSTQQDEAGKQERNNE